MNEVVEIVCEKCHGTKEIVIQTYFNLFPCLDCIVEDAKNTVEHNDEVEETEVLKAE